MLRDGFGHVYEVRPRKDHRGERGLEEKPAANLKAGKFARLRGQRSGSQKGLLRIAST
jgi:hypothetical protein